MQEIESEVYNDIAVELPAICFVHMVRPVTLISKYFRKANWGPNNHTVISLNNGGHVLRKSSLDDFVVV